MPFLLKLHIPHLIYRHISRWSPNIQHVQSPAAKLASGGHSEKSLRRCQKDQKEFGEQCVLGSCLLYSKAILPNTTHILHTARMTTSLSRTI